MARHEQDREDLLREATALLERAEIQLLGVAEPVVIGFRRNGAASVYCSANQVYQFNEKNELRRAYKDGVLIKAVQGKLVQMERQREELSTVLVTRPITPEHELQFLAIADQTLQTILADLQSQRYRLIGQVPAEANVVDRICRWLASLPSPLVVAKAPNV